MTGTSMHVVVGQTFPVVNFTAFVESVCPSGVVIELGHVSSSGFTRTGVGVLTVLFPRAREGWRWRQVHMLLSIRPEYHRFEFLNELRRAVFRALEIDEGITYDLRVAPEIVTGIISDPPDDILEFTAS